MAAITFAYSSSYTGIKAKGDFSFSPDKVFPYTEVYFTTTPIPITAALVLTGTSATFPII